VDITHGTAPETTDQILSLCASLHITLSISGGGGFTAGPTSALTPAIREGLAAHKPAIVARLLLARTAASIAAGTDLFSGIHLALCFGNRGACTIGLARSKNR